MTTKHADNTAPVRVDFRVLIETRNSSPDAPVRKETVNLKCGSLLDVTP